MRGTDCKAHRHDAVGAQEKHHLQPQSRGGRTVQANMRWLCANAHSDVHYLLDAIEDAAAELVGGNWKAETPVKAIPWSVMRTFGPGVRDAALTGWLRYADAFLRGEYARHALLWDSAGQPRPAARRRLGARSMVGIGVLALPYSLAAKGAADLDWIVSQVPLP